MNYILCVMKSNVAFEEYSQMCSRVSPSGAYRTCGAMDETLLVAYKNFTQWVISLIKGSNFIFYFVIFGFCLWFLHGSYNHTSCFDYFTSDLIV